MGLIRLLNGLKDFKITYIRYAVHLMAFYKPALIKAIIFREYNIPKVLWVYIPLLPIEAKRHLVPFCYQKGVLQPHSIRLVGLLRLDGYSRHI